MQSMAINKAKITGDISRVTLVKGDIINVTFLH